MFVITVLSLADFEVEILSMHNNKTNAIEAMHLSLSDDTRDKTYNEEEIQIVSPCRAEIIGRDNGWFSSVKELTHVYQIIEHKGTYQTLITDPEEL